MGYDNFQFGEKLNPDDFNTKFEKVFELVKKAYMHNNQLRNRLEVLNTAFSHANSKITNGSSPFDNEDNFFKHEASGSDDWTVVLGGQLFTESFTIGDVTRINSSNLHYDGLLMLDYSSESVSRIPLTQNQYGETAPSMGVTFTPNNNLLDSDRFWMLLSGDAIWADYIMSPDTQTAANNTVEIEMSIPSTLSPLVNHIKAIPILGMDYILSYDKPNGTFVDCAGEYGNSTYATGVTNKLIAADQFANNLRLKLKGENNNSGGTVFGFGTIEAFYRSFSDAGTSVLSLALKASAGDRTLKQFSLPNCQNQSSISVQIGSDENFDAGTTVFYNTDTDGYNFTGTRTLETYSTIYFKVTLTKANDTSPGLPSINIHYEVT